MSFEARFDDPADAAHGWRRWSSEPMTRLYEDATRAYFDGMRRCWEQTGSFLAADHLMHVTNGWAYARAPAEGQKEAQDRLARLSEHAATFRTKGTTYYDAEIKPEAVEIAKRLRRHPRPSKDLPTLVTHLKECIEAHAHVMGDLHWRMAGAGVAEATTDWPTLFHEITGEDPALANVLLSGTANDLTHIVRTLRRLARFARSNGDLLQAVESLDLAALEDDHPAFKRFRKTFRRLLSEYGLRTGEGFGSQVPFGAPTWNMRPELPLQMVATYARADLDALERREREVAKERRALLRRIRKGLADDPERLTKFDEGLQQAVATARIMEEHNRWMDQASSGLVCEAGDVVGKRLVADGRIDDPGDVVHLSFEELEAIAAGDVPEDLRALVAQRKAELEERKAAGAPEHIGDAEPAPALDFYDAGEGLVGRTLRGVAASPGTYAGVARVRLPSPVLPDVSEGDVLVAVDAGPDWTPLFAILGAVVLDKGANWQHAALMAREFGIPAVTGTKEGTTAIRDGQQVTVDGSVGTVELA